MVINEYDICVHKGGMMVITDYLDRNATIYGPEPAVVELCCDNKQGGFSANETYSFRRREMSWYSFNADSNRMANLLLSHGVKKGDKIGILMMNCLEWFSVYFGILKAGCIAVPLSFRYTSREIAHCIEIADVEILVFSADFIERLEQIPQTIYALRHSFCMGPEHDLPCYAEDCNRLLSLCSDQAPSVCLHEDDLAAIYFTSGTTGFPKAILHCHKGLVASCQTEQKHHSQTRDDVFLCIPPLYHTGALMFWFGNLISGSRAVLLQSVTPELILRAVSQEKCTIVWLLVPWATDILFALESGRLKKEDYLLDQWRLMHIGAQPVPASLVLRWLRCFPWQQYDTDYGLSEALGPGCVHLGVENLRKVGAIGVPGYGWEVRILDDAGADVSRGESGELAVKGPGVMIGYYKDPAATEKVLHDGWLRTGDIARQDEEGFYYLLDRKKDVIISGGENIYPVQIEDFIRKNEKVNDVAVIGLPDQRLGEIAAAIIEIKESVSCTEEEISRFCMELPRFKRPRRIFFEDIPRNPVGKIEKNVLRQRHRVSCLVEQQLR